MPTRETQPMSREVIAKLRIHKAYLSLLRVPHDTASRTHIQPALACCRDEIARLTSVSPEVVQASYESHAFDIENGEANA